MLFKYAGVHMDMLDWFRSSSWIVEILVAVALLFVVNYALKHFVKYLRRRSISTTRDWKEKIEQIIYPPVYVILWIIGLGYTFGIVGERFGWFPEPNYLVPARTALITLCFAWLLLRWKKELQLSYKNVDPGISQILGRLSTIFILFLAVLIVLEVLGLNIMPLVAFGGVGAAAIGFAGKDVIANFFGGFMLYLTRPFTVGDQILLPSQQIEGHVEFIGWYLTSIRDKDKRPVYLPNAFFSTLLVINVSRMSHRRLEQKIGIRYEDISKIEEIVDKIRDMLNGHPEIDNHLPVIVAFGAFNAYSLDISIDAHCLATRLEEFSRVKQEILLRIYEIIMASGAEIPCPTTNVILSKHSLS